MFLDERAEGPGISVALPWNTPPSDAGSATCEWCGRCIYAPAVPCSVEPVAGLADMETAPGFGDRCKWELNTRTERR